jgi:hypothetical protein
VQADIVLAVVKLGKHFSSGHHFEFVELISRTLRLLEVPTHVLYLVVNLESQKDGIHSDIVWL